MHPARVPSFSEFDRFSETPIFAPAPATIWLKFDPDCGRRILGRTVPPVCCSDGDRKLKNSANAEQTEGGAGLYFSLDSAGPALS